MEKSLEEPDNGNPSSPISSSSDDEEAAEDSQIEALEKSLAENPLEYDTYVQYIRCLRKYGHLEKLRQARESMNQRFPLSPEMWQEWIKDEISLCSSVEAFTQVEKLYECAVQEYLSVSLWCDYINFVQEYDASISQCSSDGISKMRKLLEHAVAAAGLHVTEGNKIWEAYREFEQALCLTINDSQNEEKEKQNDIVRKLYHRQLSLPLVDLRATLRDYKLWEAEQGHDNDANSDFDGVPQHVVLAYRKATEHYNSRKQYEEKIMKTDVSDTERLQEFLNYIKFEELSGDPVRIQILYERAVSRFPVSSDLWIGYTSYLDQNLKVPTILRSVYSRATRNCMWVGELWVRYLLSLERIQATEKELSDVFEQAVQCAFTSFKEYMDLFLTRVDGLRRRMSLTEAKKDGIDYTIIRETFQRATEYLSPDCLSTDELLCLHSYWARLEVSLGKDIDAACGVWEKLLKKRGTMLEVWQSYIAMELELGQIKEARSIYRRCYTKRFSGTGSEDICYSWLRFERENGTLEDYDTAQRKVAPRLKELMAFRAQQEAKSGIASLVKPDNPNAVDTSRKRKIGKVSESKLPPEKRKKYSSEPSETSEKVPAKATDQINVAKETDEGEVNNLHDTTSKQSVRTSEHRDSKHELYTDKCTAFISNLSFEANEEHLRKFFKDSGGVVAIRLLRDKRTRESRGLAYIDFSDDDHLAAAVAKNKQKLLGKKLSIARSDPKRSQKRDSASSSSTTTYKIPFGKKMTRGGNDKRDVSAAFVAAKHGGKEFTGSVTFAVPRALAQRLEQTPKEANPDQAREQPKSND